MHRIWSKIRQRSRAMRPAGVLTFLAFAMQLAMNYCAAIPVRTALTPHSVQEISELHATRLTPAPIGFQVAWSLIYSLQTIFVCRSLFKTTPREMDIIFPISCALNSLWLVVWCNNQVALASGVLFSLWLTLAFLWVRFNVVRPVKPSVLDITTLSIPTSVYAGWLTTATFVNLLSAVGKTDSILTMCSLALMTMLGWVALSIALDAFFCLSLIWAFFTIALNAQSTGDVDVQQACIMAIVSTVTAVVVAAGTYSLSGIRRRSSSEIPASLTDIMKSPEFAITGSSEYIVAGRTRYIEGSEEFLIPSAPDPFVGQ